MKYNILDVVKGQVTGIEEYGAFLSLDDDYTGLIHISEISSGFVKDINDFIKVGDVIFCKVIEVDEENKHLKLSIKDINYKGEDYNQNEIDLIKGFKPLQEHLPIWTEEKLQEINKQEKN